MYKLMIIAGPNRGTTYAVQEGESTIGRQAGNTVVLQSAKVSKQHCVLVVNNDQVLLRDQGSSNGTFVNGVLVKAKPLKAGDRISVGEYVFELTQPVARPERLAVAAGMGNVLQFPGARGNVGLPMVDSSGASSVPNGSNEMPKDLKGRALWFFEHQIMPFFYNLNLKHEWRTMSIAAFAVFAIGNLILSVSPLLEQNRMNVVRETGKRARFMAQQIAERNQPFLAAHAETKAEIGSTESAEGVRMAALVDLENRVIAPGSKLNQYLTTGSEAGFAISLREKFRSGTYHDSDLVKEIGDMIVAVAPVSIVSTAKGQNVVVGAAIVSIDTSLATPDFGEMGMVYSETLILTGILGGIILLVLYRLTLKPLSTLNEDMDRALKGDLGQVTHEFKFEELNPLWDIINSALQRVPKGGSTGDGLGSGAAGPSVDDYAGPLRMLGGVAKFGLVILDADKKIVFLNPMFEELSGIRADGAIGQEFGAVARDQSLGAFAVDLMERAPVGTEGVSEDYDFSGISYKCYAASFGTASGSARCHVMACVRVEA
jgi:PAS domain-containing protein